jgi:transposase-like protein
MDSARDIRSVVSAETIDLIAERVITALHDDLEAIAAELSAPTTEHKQLTVEQVAERLGVARSTVYAHWREWGGYKLGSGPKARIRFDSSELAVTRPARNPQRSRALEPAVKPARRQRQRRDLLVAAPRLAQHLDQIP